MAFDVPTFMGKLPELARPTLFQVEFKHPTVPAEVLERLKFLCCKVSFSELAFWSDERFVRMTFFLDEDETVLNDLNSLFRDDSLQAVVTKFKQDGEVRGTKGWDLKYVSDEVKYDWAEINSVATVDVVFKVDRDRDRGSW